MKKRSISLCSRSSMVLGVVLAFMLIASGCGPLGGMIKRDDGTVIIDSGDTGGDSPTAPAAPTGGTDDGEEEGTDTGDAGDSGDDASPGASPQIDFSFEGDQRSLMSDREIVATFDVPVDDCGTPETNDLVEITDNVGAPLACDYAWNDSCTEVTLTNIPLTYATNYNLIFKTGLSFNGDLLQSDINQNFTTLGNYYADDNGRFADYPSRIQPDFTQQSRAAVFAGSDILPDALPRNPLQFTSDELDALLDYADPGGENVKLTAVNAGEGRFVFEDSDGLLLWRDISLDPVGVTYPVSGQEKTELTGLAVTDQADPESLSLDGDGVQDLAFQVIKINQWWEYTCEVYVFYDWQNETADLSYEDADWSLIIPNCDTAFGLFDVGDFNGDGTADLCVGTYLDESGDWIQDIDCFLGSASGLSATRTPSVKFRVNAYFPESMRMGDVNCDGYSDIVYSGAVWDNGPDELVAIVLPGDPALTGTLEVGVDIEEGLRLTTQEIEDFGTDINVDDVDGDGCADIFVWEQSDPYYVIAYKGSASITSENPQTLDAQASANIIFMSESVTDLSSVMTSLDIDGDGYNDLMYEQLYGDFPNIQYLREQVFMPGGPDFFGPDQVMMDRDDAASRFITLTQPMAVD